MTFSNSIADSGETRCESRLELGLEFSVAAAVCRACSGVRLRVRTTIGTRNATTIHLGRTIAVSISDQDVRTKLWLEKPSTRKAAALAKRSLIGMAFSDRLGQHKCGPCSIVPCIEQARSTPPYMSL